MDIKEGLKRQLRSVIEWDNPDSSVLFQRWTENGDEIKNASKLIVSPGQGCIFIYQGRVEAVTVDEGLTELATENIPFWTTVKKFMQFFESEHKVGIFFFRKALMLDNKWGTTSTIKYIDPIYKFPVGLRAFGNYSFKISEPQNFFTNVVAGKTNYMVDEIKQVVGARITQPLTDYLAETKFTYADIDANREEIAEAVNEKLIPLFNKLGFIITDFRIEGTSFDENTMKRINRIADMQAENQASKAVGMTYAQVQQVEALRDAAKNEGGIAGMGVGMGAGVGLGQAMSGAFAGQLQQPQNASSEGQEDPLQKLEKLKQMLEKELINQEEYDAKKKEILASM